MIPIEGLPIVRAAAMRAAEEAVFASGAKPAAPGDDKTPELYEQIGRLKVELDWVKKKAATFG